MIEGLDLDQKWANFAKLMFFKIKIIKQFVKICYNKMKMMKLSGV